jgi:uridylate kinase
MAPRTRLLLKVSGGALGPSRGGGIGPGEVGRLANEIAGGLSGGDRELAIVVGGGNFLRGRDFSPVVDRVAADQMGMLATVLNGLALQSVLEGHGVETRVLSAIAIEGLVERFDRRRAVAHLESGGVLVLVGGTGLPYFSTDMTAVLRALELGADMVLKGTRVRGVFSADPQTDSEAKFFAEIGFDEILVRGLAVIDSSAVSLCRDHDLPIEIFDMTQEGNVRRVISGERLGTLVRGRSAGR